MEVKALNPDHRVWLGDGKSIDGLAIAAPAAMVMSIVTLMIAVKFRVSEMLVVSWLAAAASLGGHVWFALLRTRLVVALYQYLFVRWGNTRLEELVPVRRRARGLTVGAIGSWTLVVMQGLTLLSLSLAYTYPEVIPVYAVVLTVSCAYSTAFIYARRALMSEVELLRDLAPACEARL
ncbi:MULTISPECIES: hypothetical protein [unclassified Lysobacter]|uniref:hypothetical protein n=1 Tax=unclassified Lysobacter TaxID=2635362 RepID=UPI001BE9CEF9|nr:MULTISPECIES: hypothetical protein [unclassified Lysobacter]MBT2748314.1 hypothetical protein [Lysobacter sp. ISL-42]MBT2749919.1 hypothetical protein [Lysobacter sp. ISL-50]MBT2781247.1 hypothetical protein [Lysobacter sp. ISL-52]